MFAQGALEEIIARLSNSDDIDKEIREYSEAAAEQVTTASRTIYELLQNADDLAATCIQLATRRSGKGELLASHDGAPVEVAHVIAMTLAFLSLKRDDPRAKGRFGIGLKTLNQLGSKLSVHCPPYHFAIERGLLSRIPAAEAIRGVYSPHEGQTLIVVTLDGGHEIEEISNWITRIDASHLLFMDSVRQLSLHNLQNKRTEYAVSLRENETRFLKLDLRPGVSCDVRAAHFTDALKPNRTWTRYSLDYQVPDSQSRTHKATGQFTELSLALSENAETGHLFAGLPLDCPYTLPISLNAQFDPDLSRRGVQENSWNRWLFERLAELSSAIAGWRFANDVRSAWYAVPLHSEQLPDDGWLPIRLSELTTTVHDRVLSRVRLAVGVDQVRPKELSYLDESAVGLLTEADQRRLAPDNVPLPPRFCDKPGRWRRVLDELGVGEKLDVGDALDLLSLSDEELGEREHRWYLRLIDSALKGGVEYRLRVEKSLLCEDGSREAPNGEILLVQDTAPDGIASHLGLEKRLSPIYSSRDSPQRVKAWIDKLCEIPSDRTNHQVLAVLARRKTSEPLFLDDNALVLLRDALRGVSASERISLGSMIGANITVAGYEFQKGRKVARIGAPCAGYLPTPIAKDTGGWASAAKSTEGLFWLDPRYGPLLRSGSAAELGARRFFMLLGARAGPRIIPNVQPSEPIAKEVPNLQYEAIRRLGRWASHLQGDSTSPDLKRVVEDIARQRVDTKRRGRSRALFDTLRRDWDEYLSEYAEATAVYMHYVWRSAGMVPSTWLAECATEPWLSSKSKRKIAPQEAAIETTTTRLTRGSRASQYLAELTDVDSGHPLVAALGIKGTPPASELLSELKGIRKDAEARVKPSEIYPLYAALASLVGSDRTLAIGDIAAADLRRAFEQAELVLTASGWRRASEVYRGRPIFGKWRGSVPDQRQLLPLWQFLQIRTPTVDDCLGVLREIGGTGAAPKGDDASVIVDALRRVAELEEKVPPRKARELQRVPLWTTQGWCEKRPVYAVTETELQNTLGQQLPLWVVDCSIQSLGTLPLRLGVQIISDSDFSVSAGTSAEEADEYTRYTFENAVAHFRSEIGRKSQSIWNAIDWNNLGKLRLARSDNLTTQGLIGGKRISVPRRLHIEGKSRLYFVDPDELGRPDFGERIIRPFITGEAPAMLDYAWSFAWHKSENGPPADILTLAPGEEELDDPLKELGTKGKRASGSRLFGNANPPNGQDLGKRKLPPAQKPRRLKDFAAATIEDVAIVDGDKGPTPVKRPRKPLKIEPWISKPNVNGASPKAPLKEWSERERELQGFAVLAAALKQMNDLDLRDFSALRGIGADSIDNLKRFFELKVFAGDPADEVRFEPSEFERALQAKSDFFLAVVSGLEEGFETQIRIFSDPIRSMPIRKVSQLRLGGVRTQSSRRLLIKISA